MEQMISPRTFLDELRKEYNQSFRTRCGGGDSPFELKRLLNEPIIDIIENCVAFENERNRTYKTGRIEDKNNDSPYIDDWNYPDHNMHQKRIRAAQEDYYLLARAKRQFKQLERLER